MSSIESRLDRTVKHLQGRLQSMMNKVSASLETRQDDGDERRENARGRASKARGETGKRSGRSPGRRETGKRSGKSPYAQTGQERSTKHNTTTDALSLLCSSQDGQQSAHVVNNQQPCTSKEQHPRVGKKIVRAKSCEPLEGPQTRESRRRSRSASRGPRDESIPGTPQTVPAKLRCPTPSSKSAKSTASSSTRARRRENLDDRVGELAKRRAFLRSQLRHEAAENRRIRMQREAEKRKESGKQMRDELERLREEAIEHNIKQQKALEEEQALQALYSKVTMKSPTNSCQSAESPRRFIRTPGSPRVEKFVREEKLVNKLLGRQWAENWQVLEGNAFPDTSKKSSAQKLSNSHSVTDLWRRAQLGASFEQVLDIVTELHRDSSLLLTAIPEISKLVAWCNQPVCAASLRALIHAHNLDAAQVSTSWKKWLSSCHEESKTDDISDVSSRAMSYEEFCTFLGVSSSDFAANAYEVVGSSLSPVGIFLALLKLSGLKSDNVILTAFNILDQQAKGSLDSSELLLVVQGFYIAGYIKKPAFQDIPRVATPPADIPRVATPPADIPRPPPLSTPAAVAERRAQPATSLKPVHVSSGDKLVKPPPNARPPPLAVPNNIMAAVTGKVAQTIEIEVPEKVAPQASEMDVRVLAEDAKTAERKEEEEPEKMTLLQRFSPVRVVKEFFRSPGSPTNQADEEPGRGRGQADITTTSSAQSSEPQGSAAASNNFEAYHETHHSPTQVQCRQEGFSDAAVADEETCSGPETSTLEQAQVVSEPVEEGAQEEPECAHTLEAFEGRAKDVTRESNVKCEHTLVVEEPHEEESHQEESVLRGVILSSDHANWRANHEESTVCQIDLQSRARIAPGPLPSPKVSSPRTPSKASPRTQTQTQTQTLHLDPPLSGAQIVTSEKRGDSVLDHLYGRLAQQLASLDCGGWDDLRQNLTLLRQAEEALCSESHRESREAFSSTSPKATVNHGESERSEPQSADAGQRAELSSTLESESLEACTQEIIHKLSQLNEAIGGRMLWTESHEMEYQQIARESAQSPKSPTNLDGLAVELLAALCKSK